MLFLNGLGIISISRKNAKAVPAASLVQTGKKRHNNYYKYNKQYYTRIQYACVQKL